VSPTLGASFRPLLGEQKCLFIFVPDHVGGVADEFVKRFAAQTLPATSLADLGWMIFPVPDGTEAQQRAAMGKVVTTWLGEQTQRDAVRFDQQIVTLKTNADTDVHLTCLIAYLPPGT
jgi:hypothetical protein